MRRHSAIAGFAAPFLASLGASAAGPHAFSGEAVLYSENEYRGIAQNSEDPALELAVSQQPRRSLVRPKKTEQIRRFLKLLISRSIARFFSSQFLVGVAKQFDAS